MNERTDQVSLLRVLARRAPGGPPKAEPGAAPGRGGAQRSRLDPFTLAVLKAHVEQLDRERQDFGPDYRDYGVLFCWEDGRPPHPDTITRQFKKLAAAAGLPEIDLGPPPAPSS